MSTLSSVIDRVGEVFGRLSPGEVDRRSLVKFAALKSPFDPKIYTKSVTPAERLRYPGASPSNSSMLQSGCCTTAQMESQAFRYWANRIGERFRLHRKLWEFCYVLQSLYERDMLESGRKGLGFAVGEEPLPSLMASMGCTVVATDLDMSDPRSQPWAETQQLATGLDKLNTRGLCDEATFRKLVTYRAVDMNIIPEDLRDFDYTWSSCSFEHCGSIQAGLTFLREQMRCLKPGGIAVHTTEFNLSSNDETIEEGPTVIFRRKDIERVIRELVADGHKVEPIQLTIGTNDSDLHIDTMPYGQELHMKLQLFDLYTSTSIALIIRKG